MEIAFFFLFFSLDHSKKFKEYLSSKQYDIILFVEKEKDYSFRNCYLPQRRKLVANVYWKKTFRGVGANFKGTIPKT